ncbi:MAG TPA: hypothetical protein DEP23_04725 [Ruminococcaceae bacterium]|nr:hypothetical protein [Oscillospiraceae bacterium]
MIITANGKEIELRFKTRLMERFEERFGIKDYMKFWKEAANGPSLKVLEIALVTFSDGAIKDVSAAADFIDEYTAQDGKTVYTLYGEIIQGINDNGFFKGKLTADELKAEMESPILDMTEIVNKALSDVSKEYVVGAGQNVSKQAALQLTNRE